MSMYVLYNMLGLPSTLNYSLWILWQSDGNGWLGILVNTGAAFLAASMIRRLLENFVLVMFGKGVE